ncbi:MAG: hypothetical protein S4CHLAM7_13140 [Chlamydiae bacterium]|nr:hypothetical protein [Chlamydiota bacterium]
MKKQLNEFLIRSFNMSTFNNITKTFFLPNDPDSLYTELGNSGCAVANEGYLSGKNVFVLHGKNSQNYGENFSSKNNCFGLKTFKEGSCFGASCKTTVTSDEDLVVSYDKTLFEGIGRGNLNLVRDRLCRGNNSSDLLEEVLATAIFFNRSEIVRFLVTNDYVQKYSEINLFNERDTHNSSEDGTVLPESEIEAIVNAINQNDDLTLRNVLEQSTPMSEEHIQSNFFNASSLKNRFQVYF